MERTANAQLIYDYRVQIIEYKKKLRASDYKALKYAEGEISEEEYAPIREERRAWRNRINDLEYLIAEAKKQ